MTNKCILTPTYKGHFKYIKNYLKSFNKYVLDKDKIPLFFIISKNENKEFLKIIKPYSNLNLKVIFFEDILHSFGISDSSEFLLEKYGRFSFQSLKKLYGMLYLSDFKYFCVLDSESMWIKPTNMGSLIDIFFKEPFITYSCMSEREIYNYWQHQFMNNINLVLQDNNDNYWFIEQFYRYWDVDIIRDIVREHGSIYDMVVNIYKNEVQNKQPCCGLFESVLYDQYVFRNLPKYNYTAIDMRVQLKKYLGSKFNQYLNDYEEYARGGFGITEHLLMFINKNNVNEFIKMFKELKFNIIRIEESNINNYIYQAKFLKEVEPNMLVCSQNHAFCNYGLLKMIFKNKVYYKFMKHVRNLIKPIHILLNYIIEIFSVLYYFIFWFLSIFITVYKVFKKG